jgi:hypothetical protein
MMSISVASLTSRIASSSARTSRIVAGARLPLRDSPRTLFSAAATRPVPRGIMADREP